LPEAAEQPASTTAQAAVAPQIKATETILVVEDEDDIRDMVREFLERKGYIVVAANNGNDALQVAQRYKGAIHLLLTDVVMPQVGGPELAQQIKSMRPRIKILFTSGFPDHAAINENFTDQSATILQKPYPLNTLASRIRQMLDTTATTPQA
jgi:DNA-binding NtrC family response regulator